jgi:hypothetical protein
MKITMICCAILGGFLSSCNEGTSTTNSTESFNGQITYVVDIDLKDTLNIFRDKELRNRFGDTLIIKFSRTGQYQLLYKNAEDSGFVSKTYENKTGDNVVNLLNARSYIQNAKGYWYTHKQMKNVPREQIMGYDCNCIAYETKSYLDGEVTFTYCFNKSTPYVNPKYFNNHEAQCLNDYFEYSERSFLKYSFKTKEAKITYRAIGIDSVTPPAAQDLQSFAI